MQQARATVSQRLTSLVMSKMPNNNAIPGALGPIISQTVRSVAATQVNDVLKLINVPTDSIIQKLNPNIWNNGIVAANGVVQGIADGNRVSDIVGTATEPLALLKYTNDTIPTDQINDISGSESQSRYSPYAMDLFKLAPKHKFLFVCEFIFNGGYDFVGEGDVRKNEFATVISQFERPRIKYDYEDNVNYYNFRTKIPKRVIHEPLSIKFLDDRKNLSMKFFHEYMLATHPITAVDPNSAALYEQNGMNFSNKDLLSASYTSLDVDDTNTMNILKEIKVYHIYDFGTYMNVYHFTNPKVLSIALDNWSMEENEGNTIVGDFSYDGVHIELAVPISTDDSQTISTLSATGTYSLHPNSGSTYNADESTTSSPLGE
jgi:hypothetical protein